MLAYIYMYANARTTSLRQNLRKKRLGRRQGCSNFLKESKEYCCAAAKF
jgi:hypothetical protein